MASPQSLGLLGFSVSALALPGGYPLEPGATVDRTAVVQLLGTFGQTIRSAKAYSWYRPAPLVLCWKQLVDGSGFPASVLVGR
jgi:hypothetical protein